MSWVNKVAVINASPSPMITCQKSIVGTVVITPPASANNGENPSSKPHAKAPSIMETHEAANTLTKNRVELFASPSKALTKKKLIGVQEKKLPKKIRKLLLRNGVKN